MRLLLAGRLGVALLAAATLVLLTGCIKLDMDLKVSQDGMVSGNYVVALDRSVLQLTGQDPDQFYEQTAAGIDRSDLPPGASLDVEKYDQGDFVGAKVTFSGLPVDDLSDATPSDSDSSTFSLTHDGDLYHFKATLDTSQGDQSPISVPEQLTTNAEIRIKITFPGEVTETNGSKDGTSVSWEPKLGEASELTATAKDSGGSTGGGGSNTWLVVLAIVAGLAVVVVVLVLLLTRGRRNQGPPRSEELVPQQGPPPGLGSLAPPATAAPVPPAPTPPFTPPAPPPGSPLPPPS
jgi:hypothetical protein